MKQVEGGWEIYIQSFIGEEKRKIADCFELASISSLAWSPSGKHLAYACRNNVNEPYAIYLVSTETLATTKLTDPDGNSFGDITPRFSPNGELVAFVRNEDDRNSIRASRASTNEIFSIPIIGGEVSQITDLSEMVFGIDWSEGGESIYFTSIENQGAYYLNRITVRDQSVAQLLKSEDFIRNPSVTKNGKLVYESWTSDWNIWKKSSHNGDTTETKVIESTQQEWSPKLSPNGKEIAFLSDRTGHPEIWISNVDGNSPRRLTKLNGATINSVKWTPSGDKVIFDFEEETKTSIGIINRLGGEIQVVDTKDYEGLLPFVSLDEEKVYFSSDKTGKWQLYSSHLKTSEIEQVSTSESFSADFHNKDLFTTRLDTLGFGKRKYQKVIRS